MEAIKGFTKINNDIVNWEWYTDINTKVLYIHLLLKANFEAKNWRGIAIEKGQLVTSNEHLSIETGLSVSKVRGAIKKLIDTKVIAKEATNKYTKITLLKFDIDTCFDIKNNKQTIKTIQNQTGTNKGESIKKVPFDFLNTTYPNEMNKIIKKYKPLVYDWDLMIKKFNFKKKDQQLEPIIFESYIDNWIKNEKPNSDPIEIKQPKIKGFTGNEKEKISCI
ncbi:hypothetical protein [Flavobacterium sp. TSSA_36]|uniref:hypothetical protein n=1 Tax=Flavobacterium sp. TSSA_36 TaxID=3447669 RepID=UPI003F31305F